MKFQKYRFVFMAALCVLIAALAAVGPASASSSIPGGSNENQAATAFATITGNGANLWAGPGLGFWTLGTLRNSEVVPIVGVTSDRQWWQVNTRKGVGFLQAQFIAVSNADNVPPANPGVNGVVTTGRAQIRSGPGIGSPVIGAMSTGQAFFVIGGIPDGSWLNIRFRYGRGWIASVLTSLAGGAAIESGAPVTAAPRAIVNTGALNLRAGPGFGFVAIGVVRGGVVLPIIGRNRAGNWLQVQTPVGNGWVNIFYVTTLDYFGSAPITEEQAVSAAQSPAVFLVLTGRVNVRSGPNIAFSAIGSLTAGTRVAILGQSRDRAWWLVDSPFGQGWMNKQLGQATGSNLNQVPIIQ